jgi:hypothetical protein
MGAKCERRVPNASAGVRSRIRSCRGVCRQSDRCFERGFGDEDCRTGATRDLFGDRRAFFGGSLFEHFASTGVASLRVRFVAVDAMLVATSGDSDARCAVIHEHRHERSAGFSAMGLRARLSSAELFLLRLFPRFDSPAPYDAAVSVHVFFAATALHARIRFDDIGTLDEPQLSRGSGAYPADAMETELYRPARAAPSRPAPTTSTLAERRPRSRLHACTMRSPGPISAIENAASAVAKGLSTMTILARMHA